MALKNAEEMRGKGKIVQLVRKSSAVPLEEYKEYAKRMGIERILYLKPEGGTEDWGILR